MQGLDDIRWRNASYEGVIEYRVKVSLGPRENHDTPKQLVEDTAQAIRADLERRGYTVRVEHVQYPG